MHLQKRRARDDAVGGNGQERGRALVFQQKLRHGRQNVHGQVDDPELYRDLIVPADGLTDVVGIVQQGCAEDDQVPLFQYGGGLVVEAGIQEFCFVFHGLCHGISSP